MIMIHGAREDYEGRFDECFVDEPTPQSRHYSIYCHTLF